MRASHTAPPRAARRVAPCGASGYDSAMADRIVVHLAALSFVVEGGVLEIFGTPHGSTRYLLERTVLTLYAGRPWIGVAHREVASTSPSETLELEGPASARYHEVVRALVAAGAITRPG